MHKILEARERIYNHIEDWSSCGWHACCSGAEFERYCVAKDTIQDTAEALLSHRQQGFTDDVYRRYVEYYGVLQAIYMQQDAIQSLFRLFRAPDKIECNSFSNWQALRDLRNNTVGHPVGRLKRLSRHQIAYDCVNYMWFPKENRPGASADVNLGGLLDAYDSEAGQVLDSIWNRLETDCATKHRQ